MADNITNDNNSNFITDYPDPTIYETIIQKISDFNDRTMKQYQVNDIYHKDYSTFINEFDIAGIADEVATIEEIPYDAATMLALDPSMSSTGFFILDYNGDMINVGKINTSKKDGTTEQRIHKIIKTLIQIICDETNGVIKMIVFEDGYVGVNRQTSLMLEQLRGAVMGMAMTLNIPFRSMQPSEVRLKLGVGGTASKEEVAKFFAINRPGVANKIGPYSDKAGKNKTSDMYDAAAVGYAYLSKIKDGKK